MSHLQNDQFDHLFYKFKYVWLILNLYIIKSLIANLLSGVTCKFLKTHPIFTNDWLVISLSHVIGR